MAACDVLTLPSWNEGTPNVILEAFACGRRVVAARGSRGGWADNAAHLHQVLAEAATGAVTGS